MNKYGVDSKIRLNYIYNYGVNGNNIIYNCFIHKCSGH